MLVTSREDPDRGQAVEQPPRELPRPQGLAGELARRLLAAINDGALAPGDRLPTEKQLALQHGVSRAVVREAIARLKSEGYVASRQGAGAFVVARPGQTSFRLTPADMPQAAVDLRHAFELRAAIETAAAELAARRRQPADLAALRAAFAAMQAALVADNEPTAPSGVAADDAFHAAIAAATHNPLMQRFMAFLAHQFSQTRQLTWAGLASGAAGHAEAAQAEHAALLAALEAGDPVAAAAAARAHVAAAAARFGLQQEDAPPC